MLGATLTLTFRDNKKKTSTTKIHFEDGMSIANYVDAAYAIGQTIVNLSSAKLVRASLAFSVDLSSATIRSIANTAADIAQKALIIVRSFTVGQFAKYNVPTTLDSIFVDGTDILDETDSDVAALITALEDGIDVGAVTVTPRTKRQALLDTVSSTREIFRG